VADDRALREAYAAVAGGSPPHLDDEAWEGLACGELEADQRERALGHVARCAECGRILRALTLLEREARAVDPTIPGVLSVLPGAPPRRRAWLWGGLAATAAAVAAVGLLARPVATPPAVPDSEVRSVAESGRPVPLAPRGAQAKAPEVFSWEQRSGVRGYRVELVDEAGETLWRSEEVGGARLSWPQSVPATPGGYHWRVVAVLEERGETVASPLVSFRIRGSEEP
jgi:hypothetical protein